MEQTFLRCQEKEGEPRRFPFQLQCGIWQRKQPYKQCPQNNSWAGRISAFITMTEGEVNKPAPGSFCSYLEMKVTKTGAALWSSCRSPAANQQCIIPWMIYPRILFCRIQIRHYCWTTVIFTTFTAAGIFISHVFHIEKQAVIKQIISITTVSTTYPRHIDESTTTKESKREGEKEDFLIQNSQQRLLLH